MSDKGYNRCLKFLTLNGWKQAKESSGDFITFWKDNLIAIDINETEIVFLDDSGDFLSAQTNYYTLIGVLIEYRQIGFNYKSVEKEGVC